ncbi:Ribosome biogenesis regulatory protein-like protein [Smittium culicis]|uniref:Ribosome biogenesis regulatory protein n=1 Tax=Smittium culicis TaxID=133412 RepID=A0A1R1X3A5_9FUNG|nr:Ribosome biogenesis regulatory protein-like protein [Smittium culicis]
MDASKIIKSHEAKYKPVDVHRIVPVEIDAGLLTAVDGNLLSDTFKDNLPIETLLKENTRDITQLLVNELFSLPTTVTQEGVLATLPDPKHTIPREKPVPKDVPLTRWEKFAKLKGINKKKKDRMVYDDATGELRPSWGYKGMNKKEESEWLIPIKSTSFGDNSVDVRKDLASKRKENIEKNNKRKQRNVEEAYPKAAKAKLDAAKSKQLAATNDRAAKKKQLKQSIVLSKVSTASMGKFDKKLEGEPKLRRAKQKLPSVTRSAADERDANKAIISKLF